MAEYALNFEGLIRQRNLAAGIVTTQLDDGSDSPMKVAITLFDDDEPERRDGYVFDNWNELLPLLMHLMECAERAWGPP